MREKRSFEKVKVMLSDCHLSAGHFFEDRYNPHEDFHFDDEMCDLIEYYSTGDYGWNENGPVEVELIIAGDYFDFLNVPYYGEFEESITEEVALYKTEAIIKAHPQVMSALKRFASLSGKTITYLIGNHDADLFFEKVRGRIIREWDPDGKEESEQVKIVWQTDRLVYPEGIEIHHGNQFEAGNELDFEEPFVKNFAGQDTLNIPWGSIYVLKIINRLKWERSYIDKIRPVKVFIVTGLLFDLWFTFRFLFFTSYYFVKTRLFPSSSLFKFRNTVEIFKQEIRVFQDLEKAARVLLNENEKLKVVLMGHTHRPMHKVYQDGKQYINTGTWTKMIDLDWKYLSDPFRRTYAVIHISQGVPYAELRQWVGESGPHQSYG